MALKRRFTGLHCQNYAPNKLLHSQPNRDLDKEQESTRLFFWNCSQWLFGIWLLTDGDLPALFPGTTADEHSPIPQGYFLIEFLLKITTSRIVSCSDNSKRLGWKTLGSEIHHEFFRDCFTQHSALLICCAFFAEKDSAQALNIPYNYNPDK